MTWRWWWTPLVFAALAIAWTFPAATSGLLLGHHPDAAGTAWFLSAGPRLLHSLTDPATGWPAGAHYGRPDSFILIVIGALTAWLPAARALSLVSVVGVTASAWAAEGFARSLGARPPYSLLAGVGFAMSGLACTAFIEGYAYHLLIPWLPMLGWSWSRATAADGDLRSGLAAGVAFLLCLLTSAWMGLVAMVLVAVIFLHALARRGARPRPGPALLALGTVAVPLWLYLTAFMAGGGDGAAALAAAGQPSTRLAQVAMRMLAPVPSVDLWGYSQSGALPVIPLALMAVAPVVLSKVRGWRGLAWAGVSGLVLCVAVQLPWARALGQSDDSALGVLLTALVRFPERLTWVWLLASAVVGAVVVTTLARRRPTAARALLALAVLEAFVVLRMPWRQRAAPAEVPSAYQAASGPVLDVWPENPGPAPSWALWTTNLGCYYQTAHGRPIADHCVLTPGVPSPRVTLGAWAVDLGMRGDAEALRDGLRSLGFTSLVWHADLFTSGDRARLGQTFGQLDPAPVESRDGGERVIAYQLPPDPTADPQGTWARWRP